MNFYNEFNPDSAAMISQFMTDGLIAPGIVDTRSITEIDPDELKRYTQCHFFAGIAGWTFALQIAGWPTDRPVWTGSCPCQPFSSAGQQGGKEDDRHLWPVWERLITECQPATVYGEQVSSAIAHGWLDDVYQGLEPKGYAIGAAVLPACSVGSPHKRDRLWFVGKRFDGDSEMRRTQAVSQIFEGEKSEHMGIGSVSFWDEYDIIDYEDGHKRRIPRVKSGISLMVDGFQHRRPILHALGNAIVPQVAAQFIKATM